MKETFDLWVQTADQDDKALDPVIRKRKWILILSGLFVLFVASFVWKPMMELSESSLETPNGMERPVEENRLTFEMPIDSFENHLKRNINETNMNFHDPKFTKKDD